MIPDRPAQIMAMIRSGKMVHIGGRPVIVPEPQNRECARPRVMPSSWRWLLWRSMSFGVRRILRSAMRSRPFLRWWRRESGTRLPGGIMLTWAWWRGFRPTRQQWVAGFVLGALFFLVGHGTLHWAEQYVGSGLAALLIATEPMFILVLGWMMGQQKISLTERAGTGSWRGGRGDADGRGTHVKGSSLWGLLAVLLGSFSWSFGVVISPRLKLPSDALGRTALPTICGAALLLIAAGRDGRVPADALGEHHVAICVWAGLFDHVWVGGCVHGIHVAVAASSASAGGDAHVCESGGRGASGMVAGSRTFVVASGAGVGGDSGSDRADPARRKSSRGQASEGSSLCG